MTLEIEKHDRFSKASVIGISDDGCERHGAGALLLELYSGVSRFRGVAKIVFSG